MATSENPYAPPETSTSRVESSRKPSFPRGFLYTQITASVVGVLAGVSESNPALFWAQVLIPTVMLIAPFLLLAPLVLLGLCVVRRLPAWHIVLATAISAAVSFVGFWGMLPLVQ